MAKYLFVLRDSGAFEGVTAEAMQALLQRYVSWTQGLAARGLLVDASKLTDGAGRVLHGGPGQPTVVDGPYRDGAEVVGGYYIVHATSFDEAVDIAADCPHLEYGSIEIRELEHVDATGPHS